MTSELWGQFPTDLVELVLPHLPVKSKHRFRCVCKHWKRMLTAYGLPKLCGVSFVWPSEDIGPALDRDIMFGEQSVKPILVDLSFLPSRFQRWLPTAYATDCGLVVVSDISSQGRSLATSFCIFNPMTRSWRELPVLRCHNLDRLIRVSVHVTRYGCVGAYVSVLCSQRDEFVPVLADYCSGTNEWTICKGIRGTPWDLYRRNFHWLVTDQGEAFQLAYDEQEGESVQIFYLNEADRYLKVDAIPLPRELLAMLNEKIILTCHRGNAYLVVDVLTSECETAVIWTMSTFREISRWFSLYNNIANAWEQVSVVPRELLNGQGFSLDEAKVVGNYIRLSSLHRWYAYNIFDKTWEVTPEGAGYFRELLVPDMKTIIY